MRTRGMIETDTAATITNKIRKRAYRACGQDVNDPEYRAVLWTLEQVRAELRS